MPKCGLKYTKGLKGDVTVDHLMVWKKLIKTKGKFVYALL